MLLTVKETREINGEQTNPSEEFMKAKYPKS